MKIGTILSALAVAAVLVPALSAHEIKYSALLSGSAEQPPNGSPGTGTAVVTVDLDLSMMRVEASFSGLQGNVTASHIHCCTADPGVGNIGVASATPTFPGFPAGVTSGTYDMTFDLSQASTYNASFISANGDVSGAMNALLLGLESGKAYLNIHSSQFGGGEIRGFLVPEPATCSTLLIGLSALACYRRRR